SAAPGLGYSYRFDVDGKEGWDDEFSDAQRSAEFSLDVAEERTVRVQVKNAFGVTSEEEFTYVRPRPDLSRPGAVGEAVRLIRGEDGKLAAGSPLGQGSTDPKQAEKQSQPNIERLKKALRDSGIQPEGEN